MLTVEKSFLNHIMYKKIKTSPRYFWPYFSNMILEELFIDTYFQLCYSFFIKVNFREIFVSIPQSFPSLYVWSPLCQFRMHKCHWRVGISGWFWWSGCHCYRVQIEFLNNRVMLVVISFQNNVYPIRRHYNVQRK